MLTSAGIAWEGEWSTAAAPEFIIDHGITWMEWVSMRACGGVHTGMRMRKRWAHVIPWRSPGSPWPRAHRAQGRGESGDRRAEKADGGREARSGGAETRAARRLLYMFNSFTFLNICEKSNCYVRR